MFGKSMTMNFAITATLSLAAAALSLATATPATAAPFFFSTGDPDGKIATASRPDSVGLFEIESADDFVLTGRRPSTVPRSPG